LDGDNMVMTEGGRKKVRDVHSGDMVASLEDDGSEVFVPVAFNKQFDEDVSFIEVALEDGRAFNVTEEHVVPVRRADGLELDHAAHVQVGDRMITSSGAESAVASVRHIMQASRWTLGTESGTILVNDILVTSVCDNAFTKLPVEYSALQSWRTQHQEMFDVLAVANGLALTV